MKAGEKVRAKYAALCSRATAILREWEICCADVLEHAALTVEERATFLKVSRLLRDLDEAGTDTKEKA
jgi:hypothetical protein